MNTLFAETASALNDPDSPLRRLLSGREGIPCDDCPYAEEQEYLAEILTEHGKKRCWEECGAVAPFRDAFEQLLFLGQYVLFCQSLANGPPLEFRGTIE